MDEDLKARLLKPRLPEDTVAVPDVGEVRVRGLNRGEAMMVAECKGTKATERRILALGMVDPTMTEDEVAAWMQAAPAGEVEPVSRRIAELSGMLEGSAKAAYKSDGDGPEPGVRTVPGAEAGHDAGDAAPGDVG